MSTVWSSTMPSSLSVTWALWLNSTGLPKRPLAIGRASPSCRLTRRVAPSGVLSANPLAGLRGDRAGRGQQFLQVVERAHEPAPPALLGGQIPGRAPGGQAIHELHPTRTATPILSASTGPAT